VNGSNDRVETDVGVHRLVASARSGAVVFAWDYPGSTLLTVRIVRASPDHKSPPVAEPAGDSPWRVVYDGDTGSFRDETSAGASYRYAVFARLPDGPWVLWRDELLETRGEEGT
jgi:hypothetical protein